jgi:hypothetical protein
MQRRPKRRKTPHHDHSFCPERWPIAAARQRHLPERTQWFRNL